MENIESILQQAPEGTTIDVIERIYDSHNGNVADILGELWSIKEIQKQPLQNMDPRDLAVRNKLAEVRDICNSIDEEMSKYLEKIRQEHVKSEK